MPDATRVSGPSLTDGLLAALVAAGVLISLMLHHLPSPVAGAFVICTGAALLLRRMWPRTVLAVVTAAAAGYIALGYPFLAVVVAAAVAMYTLAQRESWPCALGAAVLSFSAITLPYVIRGDARDTMELSSTVSAIAMALLLPTALAVAVRLRTASMARAGAEEIRGRVEEERLEIAREVHDVLGHALAVIYMRAGVALHVVEKRPDQVKEALEAVSQASRDALRELDMTFGVFRETEEPAAEVPDLGLDRLDSLLALVRGAGLEVELTMSGTHGVLRAEVERAAYRIIQESLTNVLHHAGPVGATVDVRFEPAALLLRIANDDGAAGTVGPSSKNGGNGIPGMRERAVALGGTFAAGPREDGGFLVTARLPR
ncbi:MAG: sensor histidine kinase [Actinoallomurus sp.]